MEEVVEKVGDDTEGRMRKIIDMRRNKKKVKVSLNKSSFYLLFLLNVSDKMTRFRFCASCSLGLFLVFLSSIFQSFLTMK